MRTAEEVVVVFRRRHKINLYMINNYKSNRQEPQPKMEGFLAVFR